MRTSESPSPVAARREALYERLAAAPGVLLCLDFDGTLAPIVEEPDEAAMADGCRRALTALADDPSVEVAVVSGRELVDLAARVGVDGVSYAGNHGLELQLTGDPEIHPGARARRATVERVCERIEERTADVPGCTVERKGETGTVHYRQVPDDAVDDVLAAVDRIAGEAEGIEVTSGKQIREIRPDVDWDKGAAVERLAEEVPDSWTVVYVGDDRTDEDAFEAVEPGGIGVRVGCEAGTAASHLIGSQAEVASFLELVADAVGPE